MPFNSTYSTVAINQSQLETLFALKKERRLTLASITRFDNPTQTVTLPWNTRPVVFTTLARSTRAFNFLYHLMDKCATLPCSIVKRKGSTEGGWEPASKQMLLCFDHLYLVKRIVEKWQIVCLFKDPSNHYRHFDSDKTV